MGEIQVVYRETDKLIPYARNSRTHTDEQVTDIAASIKEFGFNVPILIDEDNMVLAGHGRLLAAKKLGLATVPCVMNSNLTDAQKKAYIIADNKIAMKSGWDYEFLRLEFEELKEAGFNLDLTGFADVEVEQILEDVGDIDPDEFEGEYDPEVAEKDLFQVAFLFPVDKREQVEAYLARVGKDTIVNRILHDSAAG